MTRNIYNQRTIEKVTLNAAYGVASPVVAEWLKRQLPRWLRKDYPRIAPAFIGSSKKLPEWAMVAKGDLYDIIVDEELFRTIGEVVDYLGSTEGTRHNLGRLPFRRALELSQEWHERLRHQVVHEDALAGTELVYRFVDGYEWRSLRTPEALDYEGSAMGHCIGRGGYDGLLKERTLRVYSLRDPKQQPHITVSIREGLLEQIHGHANTPVAKKYRHYVMTMLNAHLFKVARGYATHVLRPLDIFVGGDRFGSLDEVAEYQETIGELRLFRLHEYEKGADYIIDANGKIWMVMYHSDGEVFNIQFEYESESATHSLLPQILDRYESFTIEAARLLYHKHAIMVRSGTEGRLWWPVEEDRRAHLLMQDENYKAVLIDCSGGDGDYLSEFIIAHRVNGQIFLMNRAGLPLVSIRCNILAPQPALTAHVTLVGFLARMELSQSVYFMADLFNRFDIVADAFCLQLLHEMGYLRVDGKWQHVAAIIENCELVYECEQRRWYRYGDFLVCYNGRMVTVLGLNGDTITHRVTDPDPSRVHMAALRSDILALIEKFSLPPSEERGFLLSYGVFSSDDKTEVFNLNDTLIEYSETVNADREAIARRGIVRSYDYLIGTIGDQAMQTRILPEIFRSGYWRDKFVHPIRSDEHIELNQRRYNRPEGYRARYSLAENAPLPRATYCVHCYCLSELFVEI